MCIEFVTLLQYYLVTLLHKPHFLPPWRDGDKQKKQLQKLVTA